MISNLQYTQFQGSNVKTTGMVKNGSGVVAGVIINSHTNGSFKMFDGTLTGTQTAFGGTMFAGSNSGLSSGAGVVTWPPLGFSTGLTISTAGTIDATFLYD